MEGRGQGFRGRGGSNNNNHRGGGDRSGGGGRGNRDGGGGGRGGSAQGQQHERPKKEAILDLAKYMDKEITVKFSGGREGIAPSSLSFFLHMDFYYR